MDKLVENTEKKLNKKVDGKVDGKIDDKNCKITKNQQIIIDLIAQNPYIVREQIAKKIGISVTSVSNNLKKLSEKCIIKRVGSDKNGYWQILDKK